MQVSDTDCLIPKYSNSSHLKAKSTRMPITNSDLEAMLLSYIQMAVAWEERGPATQFGWLYESQVE